MVEPVPLAAIIKVIGLGVWTAINPCPMATNIAAISFISRRVGRPSQVMLADCCTFWAAH